MQNPCPDRAHKVSEGLSEADAEFLSTTLWKNYLQEGSLSPINEIDALIQLVKQTNELQETFKHFKDRFVRTANFMGYTKRMIWK